MDFFFGQCWFKGICTHCMGEYLTPAFAYEYKELETTGTGFVGNEIRLPGTIYRNDKSSITFCFFDVVLPTYHDMVEVRVCELRLYNAI